MNQDGELQILVADDEPMMLDLMVRRLSKMGITPDQASDGESAQTLIEQNDYDVIITDIYMPEVTGLELLRVAKERDPNVQVVIATAAATIDNAVDALNNGAFGYLTKPFDHLSVFDKVVSRAMEFRRLLLDNERMAEAQKRRGDMLEEEVTQRIQQLRDRQRDLLNLLTALPLGVAVVEEGGRVAMSNPQAERWLAEEKLADEQPIRAFMASVHDTDSEPSVEVVIAGRTVRLTAVDILRGTPKKQKVVIIGEMEHEEEGISQGTMVEEAIDRLNEGLVWLAAQPLEPKANNVVRGLVREIVSLGRMMGLGIDDPVLPEVQAPRLRVTIFEGEPESGPLPADAGETGEERLRAAFQPDLESEPFSEPDTQARGRDEAHQPGAFEGEEEAEPEGAKRYEPVAERPAAKLEEPVTGHPPSSDIEPSPHERVDDQASPQEERAAAEEPQPAPKEEKKRPAFKSRLLQKAKEIEKSGGWRPHAASTPKSGSNGKSHEEDVEPADDPVLSRLAQVTEDAPKSRPVAPVDAPEPERPVEMPAPEAEPVFEEESPNWAVYQESETGSGRSSSVWPPPLPSAVEDEEQEEASPEA
jgi:DNA-binding response OmpR family regulator